LLFGSLVDCEPHGQITPICRIGAIRLHDGHALVEVTGNPVTWPHIAQLRRLGSAPFLGIMAAGVEAATGWWRERAGHFPSQDDALALAGRIWPRDRREQRLRIGVAGGGIERLLVGNLNKLAEVHDRNAVADVLHDREVVRDEQIRKPEALLKVLEQVDDLRLYRDVKRRDRLIAHDEVRARSKRPRYADPLSLPTRELGP